MNFYFMLIGLLFSLGLILISTYLNNRKVTMAQAIAPYLGLPGPKQIVSDKFTNQIKLILTSGKSAPWASDQRILVDLRKCSSQQGITNVRFEQLIFASFASLLAASWVLLKIISGDHVSPLFGLALLPIAFILGGALRSWLLKETARRRINEIETELPAILDLLAFSVSAGEPILSAVSRVARTSSGELSLEIRRITTGLSLGENFLSSLERIHKDLGSQSVSRSFRALIMAMERGTPIAEVLRAQAMDSRNLESRKLMTLAGKKETLMMIPVVFLILPMIVIVALYPGLMALQTF